MPTEYATPREYLDDVVALVERMLEATRRSAAPSTDADHRALAELELEIARRDELIAARCEATAARGDRLPLDQLRAVFELSATEARVLAVLAALELSPRARDAAAAVLADANASATVGLIETLVYRGPRARASAEELVEDGRLFTHQLAHLGSAELPWLARPVRVARRILELALGRVRLDLEVARVATLVDHPPGGDTLLLDPRLRALALDAARRQADGVFGPIPLLVGPSGSGRTSLALACAQAIGRRALVVRARELPRVAADLVRTLQAIEREATLFDALLLVRDLEALAGDEERQVPDLIPHAAAVLAHHAGPIAVTASRASWPSSNTRAIVVVELGVPTEGDRKVLWQRALGPFDAALAEEAASRYRITAGTIERAAANARGHAAARGATIELADLRVGVRGQLDADLATLGKRVDWQQTWEDLVLPDDILEELHQLISRVRHRRRVLDDWGFARKVGKGVGISALFSGAPGTGKTMVAGLVARELQLDLYQIDVSRMVSKWIGETEKNLARLFDAATAGHAVLLFDEADSLFARRTDVKSSNDRYANLEVNYLLQRMESFDGITILTTNLESSVDDAFRRRLAFRINFPVPEVEERKRLWRAMLPAEAQVAPGLDYGSLADRFEMSGGYIRNAVMRAAYLAANDGSAITMRHLQRAATLEYTAMGKLILSTSSSL